MREPSLNAAAFPTARCEDCDREVLTHVQLDAHGAEVRCCVHCDGPVGTAVNWLNADELEANGYYFGAPPARASGGCSSGGCGTCASRRN